MFKQMYKRSEFRLKVVKHYLHKNDSLKKTAYKFGIHYQTVYKWVTRYRNKGESEFLRDYKRQWNRTSEVLEQTVAALKEQIPAITVRNAKKILEQRHITISLGTIWAIWQRYGYAGFDKKNICNDFTVYGVWTYESRKKFKQAKFLHSLGKIKETSHVLNSIPYLPKNELLTHIPDSYLNLRRRAEKMYALFGEGELSKYLKKTWNLFNECKKERLLFTALRVGLPGIAALSWRGSPKELLEKVHELNKLMINDVSVRQTSLLFNEHLSLLLGEAFAQRDLLEIKKAYNIARQCERLIVKRTYIPYHFMVDLTTLYVVLEEYKKAECLIQQAIGHVSKQRQQQLEYYLAYYVYLYNGKYNKAWHLIKNFESYYWSLNARMLFIHAVYYFMKGQPVKSIELASKSLYQTKKEEINSQITKTYLLIASAHASLGDGRKARKILSELLNFLSKKGLRKFIPTIELLLGKDCFQKNELLTASIKLGHLLKVSRYNEALRFSKEKGLTLFFYRYLFFNFDTVLKRLEKRKPTGLPKAILKLPVFNKKTPVYNIYFIGNIMIYKNQKYLRQKLQPKDTAFLIQLALRANKPDKKITLESFYRNFWLKSNNPSRNLSHLLVRIKKVLKIPSHLLEISNSGGISVLINRGIHFITDYDEYQQLLARAKALLRAGEWEFAKKEFTQAFKKFRGEPFKKMYDNYSDDKMIEILFSYETEVIAFTKELIKRERTEEAEKLLKQAKKIIPDIDITLQT